MDDILERYKRGKFHECLELLNAQPNADDFVGNFILENCKLLCDSFIRISENDPDKIYEMQELLYLFYDKVTSFETMPEPHFEQLRLVATYNLVNWLLHYNDDEISNNELEEYLDIVSEGISRVLGSKKSPVMYSDSTYKLLDYLSRLSDLLWNEDNSLMLLEFIIVLILYTVKLKRTLIKNCTELVKKIMSGLKKQVKSKAIVDEFLQSEPSHCPPLFKFSLNGRPDVLGMQEDIVDYLYLLHSTLLFLQDEYTASLKSLQENLHSSLQSLWTYLVVLNASELENWDLCLGFLVKAESLAVQKNLKARFCIMRGRVECLERNHKEAIRWFGEASELSPKCPAVWYFTGHEYARMGLYDSVMDNFQKLVEAVTDEDFEVDLTPNFETTLLDWVHPINEITETEAYYALAVAYGLNESFKEAAEIFEKVLKASPVKNSTKRKRIIQLPDHVTILHEAAIVNLQNGNLVRAEQIAMDAVDQYSPRPSARTQGRPSHFCKDAHWLEKLIYQELLETDLEPRELSSETIYSEELLFGLSQNVIGTLILSEIQRIQDVDDYKQTLSSVFSTFAKYLAGGRKKESDGREDEEEEELILVKALAGKTCLKVAAVQMKGSDDSQVDKMFKRALSCNKGDKDALHGYYTFLTRAGRHAEAVKLWKTFSKEKPAVLFDSLSSFSLRYFLTDKTTKRELDKIQAHIELTDLSTS